MDLSKVYQDNSNADAVWRAVGDGTAEVLVRPMNNPSARRAFVPVERKYARILRRGRMKDKQVIMIYGPVVAEHVLEDWRGLTDANGKAIKFSIDKARELFDKYPAFLSEILEVAMDYESFRQEEVEEVAKNLGKD